MSANTTYQDTQAALAVCVFAKEPVLLWGPPGQGKTATVNAISVYTKRLLKTVLASIREPADFAGLPNIVNGRTQLIPPSWAIELSETNGEGILFLDEISTAPPATQAALLRVVLDREVGDLYIGDISIVAAANPPDQAADGWDLPAPMANRWCHLDWILPASVVQEGFSIGWPETNIPNVNQDIVDSEVSKARMLVSSFLGARNELVTVMPTNSADSGREFPTPRSWEMAAKLYGYAKACNVSTVATRMLVKGCVGQGASVGFLSYIENLDLPDPEALLKDPSKFKVPDRGDRVFAVGLSLIAALKQNKTEERWQNCGKLIAIMANEGQADVATSIGMHWMKIRKSGRIGDSWFAASDTLLALEPILAEAKILRQ